jgi:hypothetical protein
LAARRWEVTVEDTTREAIAATAPHALRSPEAGVSRAGSAPATGKSLRDMQMGPSAETNKQPRSVLMRGRRSVLMRGRRSVLMRGRAGDGRGTRSRRQAKSKAPYARVAAASVTSEMPGGRGNAMSGGRGSAMSGGAGAVAGGEEAGRADDDDDEAGRAAGMAAAAILVLFPT